MEQERVKELLRRFYEGLTDENEETQLKEYLESAGAADDFMTDSKLFSALGSGIEGPSDDFMTGLEMITTEERDTGKAGRTLRYLLSAAAGLALVVASYYLFTDSRTFRMKDTFSDPSLAMAEVKSILSTVSRNMKAGTAPLGSLKTMSIAPQTLTGFSKMNSAVDKNLSNLKYLNQLEQAQEKAENKK